MTEAEISRMLDLEQDYWWYSALHQFTLRRLKNTLSKESTVLDLGCGSGLLLARLQTKFGCRVFGVDKSSYAVKEATRKGMAAIHSDMRHALASAKNASLSSILIFDALYFLSPTEQAQVLSVGLKKLQKDGKLILHLPAGKCFAREHDFTVGVKQRYDRRRLRKLLNEMSNESESPVHVFIRPRVCLGSIGILLRRAYQRFNPTRDARSDLQALPRWLNTALRKIQSLEDLLPAVPFGSSLYVEIQRT